MRCAISCSITEINNTASDFLYGNYVTFFEEMGIELFIMSNFSKDPESYFDKFKLEGLILSGGNSISSAPVRDKQESRLLDIALNRKLPVLGICRGMQFINYYFSKKLPTDIKSAAPKAIEHVRCSHQARIENPQLRKVLGKDTFSVNSFHDHGYVEDAIAPELSVFAASSDGIVEAICHKQYPVLGIQWHPERDNAPKEIDKKLFNLVFKQKKVLV